MSNPLHNEIFQDADKAREWLEALLWTHGRACGYCGVLNESTPLGSRLGYYQCKACRKQFTIKVGTVFERSHIGLNLWLQAAFLICASKKGISAHQMHRMMGITYKSAWFMMHRLREAMASGGTLPPLGGKGKIVEVDETFIGIKKGAKKRRGFSHKNAVLTLVERGGPARSFHVEGTKAKDILPLIAANVVEGTSIMTDDGRHYRKLYKSFPAHAVVNHTAGEYVRGKTHTNTVEGFYSVFKRGMKGVYQHCGDQHLHRYIAEFDFRYSNRIALGVNDVERTENAVKGIVGKRLTYRRTN